MNMDLKEKQIIYVDNKPHIKCDVVMLPIEISKLFPGVILLDKLSNKLSQSKTGSNFDILGGYRKPQHLYFTSDEEIKEDDYFLTNQNDYWKIQKCQKICDDGMIMSFEEEIAMFQEDTYFVFKPELCKKIFATTDKSLGLPQPSQQFIEKYIEEYNKGNQITEVLVEVILDEWKSNDFRPVIFHNIDRLLESGYNPKCNFTFKKGGLKLDSQNQITIRKQKDSWSREERVTDLLLALKESVMFPEKFVTGVCFDKSKAIKWIEENI